MQYLALIYGDESRWGSLSPEDREREMGEYMALSEARRDQGRQRARLGDHRDDRPRPQRRDARHRRPVRRVEGSPRRLLRLRVRHDRRGVRVGGQDPGREARGDRGAAGARRRRRGEHEVRSHPHEQRRRHRHLGEDEPRGGGERAGARRSRSGRRSSTSSARPASSAFGAELEAPKTAKTVRVRDGETLVTDGPFAETKEQIGGVMLLDADDLDEAISIAARIPVAFRASVELRPAIEH